MVIVLSVLAAPVAGAMGPALGGVDITDSNIRMVVVATKEECSAACDAEPACAAATFVLPGTIQGPDGHCYLKSASTPRTDNFNCYSFEKLVVLPVFACVMSYPQADFSVQAAGNQPPRGFAPLAVQFTDMSTGATERTWDFGDGSALSHGQNPVHTYTAGSPNGTYYDVTLTVLGACPGESSVKKQEKVVRVFDNIGFLSLTSTPAGASAYVDGTYVGKTLSGTAGEPLHIAPGSHTILLTLDGYTDYTVTATVATGQVTTLAPVLEKTSSGTSASPVPSSAATGSLQVMTLPNGATVILDGTPRGTSPVTVTGLTAGSHTVTLTKAGFTDYTGTLTLASGKTTMLNITLVAAQGAPSATAPPAGQQAAMVLTASQAAEGTLSPAGTGSLTVRSSPDGANVYLDGEKIGATPLTVQDVAPGTHRLLLTLQGYADITQPVAVTAGQDSDVNISFPSRKTPGFAMPAALAGLVLALLVLQERRKDR